MATRLEELPQPLQDWLNEVENFGTRLERLYEEVSTMPPSRMLEWLQVAYEIGQKTASPLQPPDKLS